MVSFNARGITGTITFTEQENGVLIQTRLRGLRVAAAGNYENKLLLMCVGIIFSNFQTHLFVSLPHSHPHHASSPPPLTHSSPLPLIHSPPLSLSHSHPHPPTHTHTNTLLLSHNHPTHPHSLLAWTQSAHAGDEGHGGDEGGHGHGHGDSTGYLWHVHHLPVDQTVDPAVQCLNNWVGPHYDPFNARSYANYSMRCTQQTPEL